MDIVIESVNTYGHTFRTTLPKQMGVLRLMCVRSSLEKAGHKHIKTMYADGSILPIAA